jgi:hypothetical protein
MIIYAIDDHELPNDKDAIHRAIKCDPSRPCCTTRWLRLQFGTVAGAALRGSFTMNAVQEPQGTAEAIRHRVSLAVDPAEAEHVGITLRYRTCGAFGDAIRPGSSALRLLRTCLLFRLREGEVGLDYRRLKMGLRHNRQQRMTRREFVALARDRWGSASKAIE